MKFEILCEEFCENTQQIKKSKKVKKKPLHQIKMNEVCYFFLYFSCVRFSLEKIFQISIRNEQEQELKLCCRTTNPCFCHCHSYNSPSQSCTSSLLFPSDQQMPLSTSLETVLSSISTQYCTCHETNSTSSCIYYSNIRTDLGYSSGI